VLLNGALELIRREDARIVPAPPTVH
jgi:hypothetical protein